ncbi:hypothetical protein J7U46_12550 [Pelomonas sp. V22]|uniref:M66 family metalloprotease n=1 Tax=Pelomonas sp. V22 TaxID=2822139 RepID=UPI0024A86075|nr:M66 family metalloprotease [Pelomonas sp. V22]MDI4633879.1 hypothetical protein [Pelomonas sp. V22]
MTASPRARAPSAFTLTLLLSSLLTACGGGGGGSSSGGGSSPPAAVVAPSILTQPSSASVQRCETVSFSVGASGGSLSYQWQRNGVDLAGATQATLQLNAAAADDGARYSVTVSNSAGQAKSEAATLSVGAVDESQLSIANIELAQVMLMDSKDAALELVQDRELLVKVNARAPAPMHCKPAGLLRIEDAAGKLQREVALAAPLLPIPATTPASAPTAASLLDSYSASVPAELVKPGLRLVVLLPGKSGAQRIAPPVSPSPAITLVAIPLQVGEGLAQVPEGIPDYIRARSPVQGLILDTRQPLRSTSVTAQPTAGADWPDALSKLLTEVNSLRTLEGRPTRTYYYGFVRQQVLGTNVGLGYRPGGAAVGYDRPERPEYARETLQHELGHNFNLQHAPCGDPSNPDTLYPYANALMGAGNRMVWGYNSQTKTFVNPGDANNHDLMSYCSGDWFSDYNYVSVQKRLRSALPSIQAPGSMVQITAAAGATTAAAAEPLLLITGEIGPRGLSLAMPRAFSGQAQLPEAGPYLLTLNLASGEQRQWRFEAPSLDHAPQIRHFHFSIPHPGAIAALSISRAGQVLHAQGAPGEAAAAGEAGEAAAKRRVQQAAAATSVQMTVAQGQLSLQWDAQRWPQLSLTQLGSDGRRRVLAPSLSGGKAQLPVTGEALGYELGLSDGLNSQLLWLDAAGRAQSASPAVQRSSLRQAL